MIGRPDIRQEKGVKNVSSCFYIDDTALTSIIIVISGFLLTLTLINIRTRVRTIIAKYKKGIRELVLNTFNFKGLSLYDPKTKLANTLPFSLKAIYLWFFVNNLIFFMLVVIPNTVAPTTSLRRVGDRNLSEYRQIRMELPIDMNTLQQQILNPGRNFTYFYCPSRQIGKWTCKFEWWGKLMIKHCNLQDLINLTEKHADTFDKK